MKWISVKKKLPTIDDGDENGKVLVYRVTNQGQSGLSKSIYDWSMVKYLDDESFWCPLIGNPNDSNIEQNP